MIFQTKEQIEVSKNDLFDQLQQLINELLKREVPNHDWRHHLLFTANKDLLELENAKSYHYKQIDVTNAVGRFHQQAYEKAVKRYNDLYLLIRGFIHVNNEAERALINHHFQFDYQLIERCYEQFIFRDRHLNDPDIESIFWQALKEDLMPVLSKFD